MDFKKIVLATGILATVGFASLLDTNDYRIRDNIGLGRNPAAIAVTKNHPLKQVHFS